jgi:predicted small secreted protein
VPTIKILWSPAMRLKPLVLAALASALSGGLAACNSVEGRDSRSGLSETFNTDNYRRSNDTNGTQTRRDVNRLYTQPSLPSIVNRGY